jgi:nicotinate phosphoribosyltransferase
VSEPLAAIRERTDQQLAQLHPGIRRFLHPHEYPVGLDIGLFERREALIEQLRDEAAAADSEMDSRRPLT